MKVIFLDFDGVLNSPQETCMKNIRNDTKLYWRMRTWLASAIMRLHYPRTKEGYTDTKHWRFKSKLLDKLSTFSLMHISDHSEFCPIACANLIRLLNHNKDIWIVVSSTWRIGRSVPELRKILKKNGIDPKRVIDKTPGFHEFADGERWDEKWGGTHEERTKALETLKERGLKVGRGTQIQAWLNGNRNILDPQCQTFVTSFVIIDDDSDMCHLMDRLVLTDAYHGFMWRDMEKVAKLLDAEY